MAEDPHIDIINRADRDARRHQDIGDLQRRVTRLENNYPTVQIAPLGAPETNPRDGSQAVSPVGPRLWVRINGAWHYAELH